MNRTSQPFQQPRGPRSFLGVNKRHGFANPLSHVDSEALNM